MANVNKVILIGRLTRDPELRYTPSQVPVTELGLAVNRLMGGGGGGEENDRKEETLFIDVTVWDRQAENCCQYLTKGRSVYVEGYLKLDSWDDKNTGEKRSKIRVVGQTVQFLDGRRDEGGGRGEEAPAPRAAESRGGGGSRATSVPAHAPAPAPRTPAPTSAAGDEDIPF